LIIVYFETKDEIMTSNFIQSIILFTLFLSYTSCCSEDEFDSSLETISEPLIYEFVPSEGVLHEYILDDDGASLESSAAFSVLNPEDARERIGGPTRSYEIIEKLELSPERKVTIFVENEQRTYPFSIQDLSCFEVVDEDDPDSAIPGLSKSSDGKRLTMYITLTRPYASLGGLSGQGQSSSSGCIPFPLEIHEENAHQQYRIQNALDRARIFEYALIYELK